MIVICEECGKKYKIDPVKIKGDEVKVRCKACNHVFMVKLPYTGREKSFGFISGTQESTPKDAKVSMSSDIRERVRQELKDNDQPISLPNKRKLGLRAKMFILFVFVPITLMIGAGLFYMRQLRELSRMLTNESSRIVTEMAERVVEEKARSVASQVQLFLLAHPLLKKEEFNKYKAFKDIAVQKVGLRGYTALYELPGSDGKWRTWAHPDKMIIGIDMSELKRPLGENFKGFWRIYTGVKDGHETRGYYKWQDKDGKLRTKFMVCTPVKGTRYVVAATTYVEEFTIPVNRLKATAQALTTRVRNLSFAVLAGGLILMGLIVSIYGYVLTKRIKLLTDLAERISVGELEAEVKIKSSDEIGDLAEAVSRMQESIRLSIERLRRRR